MKRQESKMRKAPMGGGRFYCWWPEDERNGNVPPLTLKGAVALLRECAGRGVQNLGGVQVGWKHSTGWRVGCFLSRHDGRSKRRRKTT